MASRVELAPVPAITGMRLAARSTTRFTTPMCSSTLSVGDSPVVPTATMALVPLETWKSTRRSRALLSTVPSACIGVTSATMLPLNMVILEGEGVGSYQSYRHLRTLRARRPHPWTRNGPAGLWRLPTAAPVRVTACKLPCKLAAPPLATPFRHSMQFIVISALGSDRTGLVYDLTRVVLD